MPVLHNPYDLAALACRADDGGAATIRAYAGHFGLAVPTYASLYQLWNRAMLGGHHCPFLLGAWVHHVGHFLFVGGTDSAFIHGQFAGYQPLDIYELWAYYRAGSLGALSWVRFLAQPSSGHLTGHVMSTGEVLDQTADQVLGSHLNFWAAVYSHL